jgi:flagellin-like hook-associated protein FlgL
MSGDILVSSGVRSNLLALQQTTDQITTTQTRLATGKKVNSALDNASNFFLSSSFRNSANALNSLLDGIGTASRTLDAANAGITSLTTLMNSAQGSLTQALGSTPTTAVFTGTVLGLTAASTFATTSGKTITVSDGVSTSTLTVTAATTVQQIIDSVNNQAGLTIKAELSGSGQILFEARGTTAITISGTDTTDLAQFGLVAGTTAAGTLNASRATFAAQYDAIRTQIDQLAADSAFNGVSLLNGGSLKVVYNEKATSVQMLVGVNDTAAGLGIAASAGSFQTNADINNAIASIANAITTLKNQASTFASNVSVIQARTEFTNSLKNTLNIGADGLVLADANEEGANLLALQTRQQLSSTALSLATQADQAVLRLFR